MGAALTVLAALSVAPAHAAAPLPWQVKLDPRLASPAKLTTTEVIPVWVEFVDKGEGGPGDLAVRLAAAEAALTPRARARRERAHVTPIVDYLDLPMHQPYIDALAARGFQPYGASRWFNRVAVRAPGTRISEIASLDFVRAMAPVEKAIISREPMGEVGSIQRPAQAECPNGANCLGRAQVNYGLTGPELAIYNIAAMHDSGYVGTGILICMLDDGYQYYRKHEALKDIVVPPGHTRDFVWALPNLPDSSTSSGYGWHGAMTLACAGGNKPGVFLGAAYGATFALARTEVDSFERQVEMTNWGMGAEWADSLGAEIISSSLGYTTFDTPPSYTYADMNGHTTTITRAAEIAASKGMLVLNAVGNEGNKLWVKLVAPSDANGDSVLAVGAVDLNKVKTAFSSFGPSSDHRIKPDLMAMGQSNPLPEVRFVPNNPTQYVNLSGTSFATPLMAGFAACLMQARPNFSPVQIIQAMRASADRFTNPDTLYGYGIPSGAKALQVSASTVSVPPSSVRIALAGPNPFRTGQTANIRFAVGSGVPAGAKARVNVYDAGGRRVRELWCADDVPTDLWIGVTWNGNDSNGHPVRPGLYFVSLEVGRETQSARLVYLR